MVDEIDKAKYEQEQKRKLWREQQKARLKTRLSEKAMTGDIEKKQTSSTRTELPKGRSPKAIAARLKAAQAQESIAKQKTAESSKDQVAAKVKEIQKITKSLKNLYRIVNGAAGVTLVGVILTFLVMNAQLLLGNLLKVKLIPSLSLIEIIIICFIDMAILGILLISSVMLIIMVTAISDPWELIKLYPAIVWDLFKSMLVTGD